MEMQVIIMPAKGNSPMVQIQNPQHRAFNFYKRPGFYEIPRYSNNEEDAAMEMIL